MKIKTICLSGLLFATAACSNSSDGKNFDAGNVDTYKELQDLDIRQNGKFTVRGEVDLSDSNQAKEIYNFGCEVEGRAGGNAKVDGAARKGDSIISATYKNTQNVHSIQSSNILVEDIQGEKMNTSSKILSVQIQEAGGEVLQKPIEFKYSCTGGLEEKSGDYTYKTAKCDYSATENYDVTPYLTEAGIRYKDRIMNEVDCEVKINNYEPGKTEIGTYQMANGLKVKSTRNVRESKGEVICNGKSLGKGMETEVLIRSNDLVSLNFWYCGGSMVSESKTIRVGDKVIHSTRTEVQAARAR